MSLPLVAVRLPSLTPFARAWALQRALHAEIAAGARADTLLLLEHPRTITMGRRGGWGHLRTPPDALLEAGFQLWHIDRGGDITYHGPGQLVGYPIVNLRRAGLALGDFVRGIERAHIALLGERGVVAEQAPGFTGVWVGREKITAIGVRVTAWTTMHGFAINVATNLEDFDHIVACGLDGRGVTSLARVLSSPEAVDDVAAPLAGHLARQLGLELRWEPHELLPVLLDAELDALESEHRVRPGLENRLRDASESHEALSGNDEPGPSAEFVGCSAPPTGTLA